MVDFPIYYISFDRKENLETELKEISNRVELFEAVDGQQLKENITELVDDNLICTILANDLEKGIRLRPDTIPDWGSLGCYFSHVSLWHQLINDDEHNAYMICEADVSFHKSAEIGKLYEKIKDKYDSYVILYGYMPANSLKSFIDQENIQNEEYNDYIKLNEPFYGLHGYILSKTAAKKLVKNAFPVTMHIDSYVTSHNNKGLEIFTGKEPYAFQNAKMHDLCITCALPQQQMFYLILLIILMIISLFSIVMGLINMKYYKINVIFVLIGFILPLYLIIRFWFILSKAFNNGYKL